MNNVEKYLSSHNFVAHGLCKRATHVRMSEKLYAWPTRTQLMQPRGNAPSLTSGIDSSRSAVRRLAHFSCDKERPPMSAYCILSERSVLAANAGDRAS
jgi:hypothetical protein